MSAVKAVCVFREGREMPTWVAPTIEAAGIEFAERDCKTTEEALELGRDADIVWIMGGGRLLSAEDLPQLGRCGAIVRSGSGTDNIPVAEATRLGIIVANTPGATAIPVAEHAIALLLSVIRKITVHDRRVREGRFSFFEEKPRFILHGSTIGLIGFGHIARGVAARLRPFGTRVLACDPVVSTVEMAALGVEAVELPQLLATADFVSVHTPLLDETFHLLGEAELKQMKPSGILINTSRGEVVDQSALTRALQEGWIEAAGLDVLESEPPDIEDPLLGLPNVVLTSHIAGCHKDQMEDFWRLSMETVIDLGQRKWPVSYVNPGVEARWEMRHR